MWKKSFQLIPATLFCFCIACGGQRSTPEFSREITSSQSIFMEEEPSLTQEKKEPSPFWDTSNVNILDVDPTRKLISFTFDDAPARTFENILATFAAFNEEYPVCPASATVFLNGKRFDEQTPHLLHVACALGFELGNHTHSHKDLTTLSDEEITKEIDATDRLLEKIDGRARHLLRAPFGRVNDRVKNLAPVPLIDWTIDTLDWTGVSEDEIYDTVFENKFSGAIVLMHDGYEPTVSALKRLLPDLEAEGYQVVSLSKMIKTHGCVFRRGGVYIRARKRT